MHNDAETVLVGVSIVIFAVLTLSWRSHRSQEIIQSWAERNAYQVLRQEFAPFNFGPFF